MSQVPRFKLILAICKENPQTLCGPFHLSKPYKKQQQNQEVLQFSILENLLKKQQQLELLKARFSAASSLTTFYIPINLGITIYSYSINSYSCRAFLFVINLTAPNNTEY